jgi:predicted RND superfamily exporter protein
MNKAITINHEDGRDVWAVQMFELPKHQYDTSIDIIDKEQEESKIEAKIEVIKAKKLLELMGNKELSNQAAREAKILIDLEGDNEYVTLKANLESLKREIEILKAPPDRERRYLL